MYNLQKEERSSCHNQGQQVKGNVQRKQLSEVITVSSWKNKDFSQAALQVKKTLVNEIFYPAEM